MDNKPPPEPWQSDKLLPMLGHLLPHSGKKPTQEQTAKENARRRGRRRKDWWKEQP